MDFDLDIGGDWDWDWAGGCDFDCSFDLSFALTFDLDLDLDLDSSSCSCSGSGSTSGEAGPEGGLGRLAGVVRLDFFLRPRLPGVFAGGCGEALSRFLEPLPCVSSLSS